MTFVLSKLLWLPVQPVSLLVAALCLGSALLFTRYRRGGRALVAAAAGVLLVCAFLPIDRLLLSPLEGRFPPPAVLPATVAGIVVLGGAVQTGEPGRGPVGLNDHAERLWAVLTLAHAFPEARIVYSGGSAAMLGGGAPEAPAARTLLAEAGFDVSRIVFEPQARNTYENAIYSKEIAAPRPGETWLLVTSAAHMPRAIGVFHRLGWPVIAYPVDFTSTDSATLSQPADRLHNLTAALREWVGLIAYRWLGYTNRLFPAPDPLATP